MPKRKAISIPAARNRRPRLVTKVAAAPKEEEEEDSLAASASANPNVRGRTPPLDKSSRTKTKRQPQPEKESSFPEEEEEREEEETSLGDDDDDDDSEATPPAKYYQGQKILARDEDGLLYQAFVRRSLWGIHQHKQIQVGMFSSQKEMLEAMAEQDVPTWHYFVHFNGWKHNWDRWVSQDDILELECEANLELAKRIQQEHRALQKQFKANKNCRTIDGAAFLKAWKQCLVRLMGEKDGSKKKKASSAKKYTKATLEKEYQLHTKHGLTHRKPSEAQQIVLSFGLKRILVEDWELTNQFDMVSDLPAKVTIRNALDEYLKSKGIIIVAKAKAAENEEGSTEQETTPTPSSSLPTDQKETPASISDNKISQANTTEKEEEEGEKPTEESTTAAIPPVLDEETIQRNKKWIDMADGIALFFDQALPFRLLHPSEKYQLAVLESMDEYKDLNKAELYGCEHLLRMFCRLPSILADFYTIKDNNEDGNDATSLGGTPDEDTIKPIIAKINDLARFLQKNQSALFHQSYRKKNEEELRLEQKEAKRQERKRKLLLGQQEQAAAAAAAAAVNAPP